MDKFFDYEFFKSLAELYKDLTGIEIPEKTVAITFILTITIIVLGIIVGFLHKNHKWRKNQLDEILKGYENYTTRQERRLYIDTGFQTEPPHDYNEPSEAHYDYRESSINFYIKDVFKKYNDKPPYYCILGGSGMGKSTFVVNLVRKYINKYSKRTLPYQIKLLYCGESTLFNDSITNRIDDIQNKANTILLLDALDENNEAINDFSHFFPILLNKLQDFRTVIITCRTQFFETYEDEPSFLPFRDPKTKLQKQFKKYYISPLRENEIRHYLRKKFLFRFAANKKSKSIVKQCKQLMARPLLLSYIEDLVKSDINDYSISKIYEIIINKWIEREANFAVMNENDKEKYKKDLFDFSSEIALCMAQTNVDKDYINKIINKYSSIITTKNLKGRSLLNRNSNNEYKFAHKSFMEFIVANSLFKSAQILKTHSIKEIIPMETIDLISNDMIPKFLIDMIKREFYEFCSISIDMIDRHEYLSINNLRYNGGIIICINCHISENILKLLSEVTASNNVRLFDIDCYYDFSRIHNILKYYGNSNRYNLILRDYNFKYNFIIAFLQPLIKTKLELIEFYIKDKNIFDDGDLDVLKFLKQAQYSYPRALPSVRIRILYYKKGQYIEYANAFENVSFD